MIAMEGKAIVYREQQLPILLRLFILFLGLGIAVVIPTPFVIHADWTMPSPTLALAVLCIIVPIAVGIFFVLIALVSATELRFDPLSGLAVRTLRGPVVNRRDSIVLSEVSAPKVFMRDSEDGPFPILQLHLSKRRRVEMACFADLAEAEFWADAIYRLCRENDRHKDRRWGK